MTRLAAVLALGLASAAGAQSTRPGDLVPIEQGVSDMNTMGTSLRLMPVDLGTGNTFTRLYGVAGRPDLLVRSQGGIYAVFEQSDYVRVQKQNSSRVYAVWPAGTVFHIGRPDFSQMRVAGVRHGPKAAMLFAPGLQPQVTRKAPTGPDLRGPDPRVGRRASADPIDLRAPDARVASGQLRSADDARTRGGSPGYGRPVPRPAPEADRDPASRGGDAPSPSGSTRE